MAKRKKKPELKVVFDTNAIYSGTASYLINIELTDLIKDNLTHHDLDISWHLPDTVIKEREFQMIKKGTEFLQPIGKLETLLGHNLNITEEIIQDRVKSNILKQIEENHLSKIILDTESIEWNTLIKKALKRVPPFEDNKSEKGFRDCLILEAFDQLVQSSPKTASSCRIAFVCNDSVLMDAVKERTKERNNIRYISDLTGLKGLINILVSEIEEKLITEISSSATELFFEPDNPETIYYKEEIRKALKEKFNTELYKLPDSIATKVETGTWYISPVNFVKKEKQRIWWSSTVKVDLKAYKKEYNPSATRRLSDLNRPTATASLLGNLQGSTSAFLDAYQNLGRTSREVMSLPETVEYLEGSSKYEVIWSVTYTANKKFIKPVIEDIKFTGNEWGNE
nr:PIN domain-containing protein [uncultured Carboxylicivirga sp.]